MKFAGFPDDSGFLGIVNTHLYKSFVKEDWAYEDIVLENGMRGRIRY
jgi:hypothetical protein